MSWHTLHTKTTTHYANWHYHAHIVAPIELFLNYELKSLYLLKTSFSKTPEAPFNMTRSAGLSVHRRFHIPYRTKLKRTRHRLHQPKKQQSIKFKTKKQTQLLSSNNHFNLSHVNAKVHNDYATLHLLKRGITKKPKHPV